MYSGVAIDHKKPRAYAKCNAKFSNKGQSKQQKNMFFYTSCFLQTALQSRLKVRYFCWLFPFDFASEMSANPSVDL